MRTEPRRGPETPPSMSPGLTAAWCCVLCCLSSPPAATPALHPHGYRLEGMGVGEPGCPCCRAGLASGFKELSWQRWADFLMPPWFVSCPGLPVSVCQSLPNATVMGKWRSRQWGQIGRASPCWGGSAVGTLRAAGCGCREQSLRHPSCPPLHPREGRGGGFGQHPWPLHCAPPARDPRTPLSSLGAARARRQSGAAGGERRAPRPGEGRWQWRTAPGRRSCAGGGSTGAAPTSLRIPQPRRGCRRPPGPECRDAGGCRPRSATPRPARPSGTRLENGVSTEAVPRGTPAPGRGAPRAAHRSAEAGAAPRCRGSGPPPVGLRGPVDGGSRSRSHQFASPLGAGTPHPTRAARIPPCCGSGP